MSYLITEDRLARLRRALQASADGVLIADGAGRIRFVSEAFSRFFRRPHVHLADMDDLPRLFHDQVAARGMVRAVMDEERSWRGELLLDAGGGSVVPLAIRADVIPRLDGLGALGRIVLVTNMTEGREADAARDRVHRAIRDAQRPLQATRGPVRRERRLPGAARGGARARVARGDGSGRRRRQGDGRARRWTTSRRRRNACPS